MALIERMLIVAGCTVGVAMVIKLAFAYEVAFVHQRHFLAEEPSGGA